MKLRVFGKHSLAALRAAGFVLAVSAVPTSRGCHAVPPAVPVPEPRPFRCVEALRVDARPVVDGANALAFDLYGRLRQQEGNLVFAPASIATVIAMAWDGAGGETASEMARVLHLPSDPDSTHRGFSALTRCLSLGDSADVRLNQADRIFGQVGLRFRDAYLHTLSDVYRASVDSLPFATEPAQSRVEINRWVASQTAGYIPELLPEGAITNDTRLVLTDAVFFKARWLATFDTSLTRPGTFTIRPGRSIEVPMMSRDGIYRYASRNGVQILELPYVESGLRMICVLPDRVDGLAEVEAGLGPERLREWLDALDSTRVNVRLPRITANTGFRLDRVLAELGMPSAFDARGADFSGMDGRRDLSLTAVIHQALVQVNEEGTVAAAATAGVVGVTSVSPIFAADHPFLFLIHDLWSGAILFIGRIENPAG